MASRDHKESVKQSYSKTSSDIMNKWPRLFYCCQCPRPGNERF